MLLGRGIKSTSAQHQAKLFRSGGLKLNIWVLHGCAGVIRQLGDFYKKQGQRSRLPRSVGEGLLAKLDAAQNALPLPAAADGKQKA